MTKNYMFRPAVGVWGDPHTKYMSIILEQEFDVEISSCISRYYNLKYMLYSDDKKLHVSADNGCVGDPHTQIYEHYS